MYVGMTNRGWGSLGGKPYGLQRLVYTGVLPFEIKEMKLTKEGFDLTFTKPLDAATAPKLEAYSLSSFTHYYWGTYGSPEVDRKAEKVQAVKVSTDGKMASLKVDGFRPAHLRTAPRRREVNRRRRGAAPRGVLHAESVAVTAGRSDERGFDVRGRYQAADLLVDELLAAAACAAAGGRREWRASRY